MRRHRLGVTSILLALLAASAALAAADGAADARAGVIERYGLEQGKTPVSERTGWHKPRRILVAGSIAGIVPQLRAVTPGVEFVVAGTGSIERQAAGVDAVIGACTADILAAGKSIQWIQLLTAGVERCVSLPAVRERDILVTNMQRISGRSSPSMSWP